MFNNFLLYNIKLINYSNKTVCREKCTSIRVYRVFYYRIFFRSRDSPDYWTLKGISSYISSLISNLESSWALRAFQQSIYSVLIVCFMQSDMHTRHIRGLIQSSPLNSVSRFKISFETQLKVRLNNMDVFLDIKSSI